MEIIDRGTVFAGKAGTDRQSCAFPGICILPSGRWLCTFRAAPLKQPDEGQKALLTWSDDEGRSWSDPVVPFSPPLVDGKPGYFRSAYTTSLGGSNVMAGVCWTDASRPDLPLFNQETEGLLDARIFIVKSTDNGMTWSPPELMDTSPFDVPVGITGHILRLPDGRLGCHLELNKKYYDTSPWKHSALMMFSSDEGRTWSEYVHIARDPDLRIFYWDQHPQVLDDGRMLDVFWTFDRKDAVYLNIHACESLDSGRTWSGIWDAGIPGQPAPPFSLPDGRIGLVYVDRTGIPTIKMRVSSDKGHTWPDNTELIIATAQSSQTMDKGSMADAWKEMYKFSIGLPDTAILPNGELLVVYYSGIHTDHTDIKMARIRLT